MTPTPYTEKIVIARSGSPSFVMAGLDPAIHVFISKRRKQGVDHRASASGSDAVL
jgi:hypothetical protein